MQDQEDIFFFLFTEEIQVKFIVPPGVNRVVQLCFDSEYEVELVLKSIYKLPYGDSDTSCICRYFRFMYNFCSLALTSKYYLFLSRYQQTSS